VRLFNESNGGAKDRSGRPCLTRLDIDRGWDWLITSPHSYFL
jgi:hypothetical protein